MFGKMKRKKIRLRSGIAYKRKFYKNTLPALLALPFLFVGSFVLLMETAACSKPSKNSSGFQSDKNYEFSAIDRHALNAPYSAESSIPALASYLSKAAGNDREKVRAIFRWITSRISYNTAAYFSGSYGDTSPAAVLRSRSSICMGYAGLFKALCDQAGIKCVIINGYAKGYGYRVGGSIGDRTNHSCNAVNINGKWRLVDPTWGAGHIDPTGKYLKKYEEFYFFTPPHFFITDHLPDSPEWQLLDKPITAKQYAELPKLNSQFFKLGFSLDNLSHKQIEIQTGERLDVKLKSSRAVYLIAGVEDGRGKEVPDATLVRVSGREFTISAVFKRSGEYILRIYGNRKIEKKKYPQIVSYKISAKVKKPDDRACYPKTFGSYSTKNAYLFSPLSGYLKSGRNYTFRIKLPGAQRAAVVIGSEWNHLKRERKEIFTRRITAKRKAIVVYAQYPGKDNYTAILRYTGY
jgi:hypothetical protein